MYGGPRSHSRRCRRLTLRETYCYFIVLKCVSQPKYHSLLHCVRITHFAIDWKFGSSQGQSHTLLYLQTLAERARLSLDLLGHLILKIICPVEGSAHGQQETRARRASGLRIVFGADCISQNVDFEWVVVYLHLIWKEYTSVNQNRT